MKLTPVPCTLNVSARDVNCSGLTANFMIRDERKLLFPMGFDFTGDVPFEIDRFPRKEGPELKPITVREILDEELDRRR